MVPVRASSFQTSVARDGHTSGLGKARAAPPGPGVPPDHAFHQSSLTSLEGSGISEHFPQKSLRHAGRPHPEVRSSPRPGPRASWAPPGLLRAPAALVSTSHGPAGHSGPRPGPPPTVPLPGASAPPLGNGLCVTAGLVPDPVPLAPSGSCSPTAAGSQTLWKRDLGDRPSPRTVVACEQLTASALLRSRGRHLLWASSLRACACHRHALWALLQPGAGAHAPVSGPCPARWA